MTDDGLLLRPAQAADVDAIADVGRRSRRHFMPYLPVLHSHAEDQVFVREVVMATCTVHVAVDKGGLVGFCAFREGWVDHLYLLPGHVGRGLGASLLNKAKECHPFLQLWVFQQNTRAIRFYERNGFHKVLETDGAGNEEKTPDALYAWGREG